MCPVRVRKSIPLTPSSPVSSTSLTKAGGGLTRLCRTCRNRSDLEPPKLASITRVRSSSAGLRAPFAMDSSLCWSISSPLYSLVHLLATLGLSTRLLIFGRVHTETWDLQFLSHNPGSFNQRTELAKGYFPWQVFHAAIPGQDQGLRLYILQRRTNSPGHYLRCLQPQRAHIQDAHNVGFMCEFAKD